MTRTNISFGNSNLIEGTNKLVITFANGSTQSIYFKTFTEAHAYARDKVSYSSGSIAQVAAWPGDGSEITFFKQGWDDVSNKAAMELKL